ncbi:putative periplasmic protein [Hydrogenimonas sp.]|nr:putative periplasmic protein [Hydrogenimonas sp.]
MISLYFRSILALSILTGVLFGAQTEPSVFPDSTDSLELRSEDINETPGSAEQLIYLNIEKLPEKIYVGQIFPVTVKVTSLERERPLYIRLEGGRNIRLIKEPETIEPKAISRLAYYFKATGSPIRLPYFIAAYSDEPQGEYQAGGETVRAVRLNPPKEFCNVLAKRMELINYQASTYTGDSNILALQLKIDYGNFDDFHLQNSTNQGIDSFSGDINDTTLFYYAVYPAGLEQLTFSYFNLEKNRYEKFRVPIIVKRSSVSTQSNLDPQASEFTKFKIATTAFFITLWLILWAVRKSWIYPLLIMLAGAYLVTYLIPLKSVCIKPQSRLYLLPTMQSTPFMTLYERTEAKKMNGNENYTKIQLPNSTIGWVKNEDLCSN